MQRVGCLAVKRPRLSPEGEPDAAPLLSSPNADPGGLSMAANQDQALMLLGRDAGSSTCARRAAPRPTPLRERTVQEMVRDHRSAGMPGRKPGKRGGLPPPPGVPLSIGPALEEAMAEEDEEEPDAVRHSSFSCPFLQCPESLGHKTRRAMVAHLAARHVAHGQPIPVRTLQDLRVRLCDDPCRTLVPAGSRCRNCLASASVQGEVSAGTSGLLHASMVPVPMCPPPPTTTPPPGSSSTSLCPALVPSFEEIL